MLKVCGSLIWITGLSGSGKTTIGNALYLKLKQKHTNVVFLDGDSFREILGNDLGHNPKDRLENAYRIHRMCKFLVSQNIHVVCATMSLYKEIHELNRSEMRNYLEIFIECEIDELIRRDQKGLYSQAIIGKQTDVVGVNLSFDKPQNSELTIDNTQQNALQEKVQKILDLLGEL
ncbi:MAG: adenylyl-sulfate kinase [Sulfuricurvum sp.]|nr:adenylyl-sulfate kinase [Sulfuricurvum sp.]